MNKKNVIIALLIIAVVLASFTIILNLTFDSDSKLSNSSLTSSAEPGNLADGGQISITVNEPQGDVA